MERALSELVNLNVYALLGLEVDGYDTAPCRAVQKTHDELRNARRGIGTARRDRMNQKSKRSERFLERESPLDSPDWGCCSCWILSSAPGPRSRRLA
jgi:hypothetical protein